MTDAAETRGKLIRRLEEALALADEIGDADTGFLIERALDEAIHNAKWSISQTMIRFPNRFAKLGAVEWTPTFSRHLDACHARTQAYALSGLPGRVLVRGAVPGAPPYCFVSTAAAGRAGLLSSP